MRNLDLADRPLLPEAMHAGEFAHRRVLQRYARACARDMGCDEVDVAE